MEHQIHLSFRKSRTVRLYALHHTIKKHKTTRQNSVYSPQPINDRWCQRPFSHNACIQYLQYAGAEDPFSLKRGNMTASPFHTCLLFMPELAECKDGQLRSCMMHGNK